MTEITTVGNDFPKIGDVFSIDVPDRRKWVRFWHWVLRKEPPLVRRYYTCVAETGSGIRLIEPAILPGGKYVKE